MEHQSNPGPSLDSITGSLRDIESALGAITHRVEHRGARLSIFEIRSLNRIVQQVEDLFALDRRA